MNDDRKILIEWANRMSEELLGYREGSLDEILARAVELKNIETQHKRQEKVFELFSEIKTLSYLADDIENG